MLWPTTSQHLLFIFCRPYKSYSINIPTILNSYNSASISGNDFRRGFLKGKMLCIKSRRFYCIRISYYRRPSLCFQSINCSSIRIIVISSILSQINNLIPYFCAIPLRIYPNVRLQCKSITRFLRQLFIQIPSIEGIARSCRNIVSTNQCYFSTKLFRY